MPPLSHALGTGAGLLGTVGTVGTVEDAPPVNTTPPQVAFASGSTGLVGEQGECDPGTWTGSPTFAYQWKRSGTQIPFANNVNYLLTEDDAGDVISCTVTAENAFGTNAADSNTLNPLELSAPNSTASVVIADNGGSGIVVSNDGQWVANPPASLAYEWEENDGGGFVHFTGSGQGSPAITGVTTGWDYRVTITAANTQGSSDETSNTITKT